MKVTGFTIARNVVKYDYPIKEAILSVLPLCDEFVVAVGKSEDETLGFIKEIESSKIRIIETVWDESLSAGGQLLANETNKALDAISDDTDWAFYIQGDEVIHEKYLPNIKDAMQKHANDARIEGLLFGYLHFYGSYDYVADSRKWYKREVRIVRKRADIRSFRDAQGFRKNGIKKINVAEIDAAVYHYGWVKHPDKMLAKMQGVARNWAIDAKKEAEILSSESFDYSTIDSLKRFEGTHPQVIQERINEKNWTFEHDISKKKYTKFRYKILMKIEEWTGYRIGEFRNFKIIS